MIISFLALKSYVFPPIGNRTSLIFQENPFEKRYFLCWRLWHVCWWRWNVNGSISSIVCEHLGIINAVDVPKQSVQCMTWSNSVFGVLLVRAVWIIGRARCNDGSNVARTTQRIEITSFFVTHFELIRVSDLSNLENYSRKLKDVEVLWLGIVLVDPDQYVMRHSSS